MDKNYYQGCAGAIDPREIMNFDFKQSVYLAEQKYDGIYIQLVFDVNGKLKMISRNMKEKDNEQLESLRIYIEENLKLKDSVIVGELAFSTQAGTEYQKKYGHSKVDVFDILKYKGKELHEENVFARKEMLRVICENLSGEYVKIAHCEISTEYENFNLIVQKMFDDIVRNGGEGVIVKDCNDKDYIFGGKSKLWYKIKKLVSMDYIIVGYEDSESDKYKPKGWIKNIMCGLLEDGVLVEKVRVGSMTEEIRQEISENRTKYLGTVVEVHGFEIFKSGSIRHPSFLRFRDDKDTKDCTWEKIVVDKKIKKDKTK